MLDLLATFRLRAAGQPLLLFVAVVTVLVAGRGHAALRATTPVWMARATRVIAAAGIVGLIAFAAMAIWYASDPHFFDNAEPTMVAVGWMFHLGRPLYPAPDAAEQYAQIYGPMAFILHGFALGLLGPSIGVSKGLAAGAGIASLALLYPAIRPHGSAARALALTGIAALLMLLFRQYSFWTRPEPFQLLAVSASLLIASSGGGLWRAMMTGLVSGVLWNLKFTGPLYSLPVFALLERRAGWRGVLVALATGTATALAPFWLFANVSLTDYVTWSRLSARTGLLFATLRQNLGCAAYLSVPLLLSYYAVARAHRPRGREWRNVVGALVAAMCGVAIAGAKPGAGSYHLLPFVPIIMYIVSSHLSHYRVAPDNDPVVPRAAIAFVLVAIAIVTAEQALLFTTIRAQAALGERDDIVRFAATHDGVVEMGYGRTESLTLQRPVLVFRNDAYLLDQPAIREHQLAGIEIPQATIDAVASCRVRYWLIPKGESPFSGVNSYAAVFLRPLYPAAFRRTFAATHRLVATTDYFDAWECRAEPLR